MARIWQYQCVGCNKDIVAGSRCWECPQCGNDLRLITIIQQHDPLEDKEVSEAMRDVLAGFDDLLKRS